MSNKQLRNYLILMVAVVAEAVVDYARRQREAETLMRLGQSIYNGCGIVGC